MNPRYRVVIVGCGNIGGLHEDSISAFVYSHGRAFSDHASFEIVGCVDSDLDRAREFSEKYRVRSYGNEIEDLINKTRPHLVSVCTPDATHYEVTKRILAKKRLDLKLIFLEKPACEDPNDFSDMVAQSESLDVPIVVNMSRRYHSWYQWIKENYDRNVFGSLLRADIFYYGGWSHNGVHAVDVVHFLFSEKLTNGQIFESLPGPTANDATYTAKFNAKNGSAIVWFHGFSEEHYQVFDCDFKFTEGRVQVNNFEEKLEWKKVNVNALGERILVDKNTDIPEASDSPITKATQVIETYLDNSREEYLSGYLLQDMEKTMEVVWEINGTSNARPK